MAYTRIIVAALLVLAFGASGIAVGNEQPAKETPWGKPVDGLACRLRIQPRYMVGQAVGAVIEVKNVSDKKRFIVPRLDPQAIEYLTIEMAGPKGPVRQTNFGRGYGLGENSFQPIAAGEIKRFEVSDLRSYFGTLNDWECFPQRKANAVATGKYTLQLHFRSPKAPPRFLVAQTLINGKQVNHYKDVPAEVTAGQWANEIVSAAVAFEMAPLGKDDLVVHEWGVFTVFNDVKYANANRKEEWGNLPSFFYRQFPTERLRWVPSAWDKPIVYFYAKPTPMRVNVKVTFAEEAPVVWWPAVAAPVEQRPYPNGPDPAKLQPFRSLTWEGWLGDKVPPAHGPGALAAVTDFELPKDCWLREARLPGASRLTVVGNIEGPPKVRFPGGKDRSETERFLYYDGLVPAPDYLRCEKIDAGSVTLRNRAKFDITRLFLVDHRVKGPVGFAFVDGKTQTLKAGETLKIELKRVAPEAWFPEGLKHVRQALLDAGLFEPEADALLRIWDNKLLQAEGVTAFHILPPSEYDRMLPLDILPVPAARPVRVGIALHPHVEIEPVLTERVGGLIRDLDSTNFARRDAAAKTLLNIGPVAISMLRAELKKNPPLEVTRQIQALLDRIDASDWLNFPQAKKGK